ncbi:MAG: ABC transporter ATP-binding protein [Bdellovibrionales bacterium]|nr:ABC transporter ATP-binding protein [Bdellovibrionales bacterium]
MEIVLANVSKHYGSGNRVLHILKGVSAVFESGKTHAIRGPSGIGKSTLLHLLARLDNVNEGEVRVGGTEISSLSEEESSLFRRKNIGMIFQFHHLLPEFTARENVMMPLLIRGEEEGAAGEEADRLLTRIGIDNRSHHRPSELSGGEQQRVAIARALAGKPGVVLADEPTGNLDPENAESISALLCELTKEVDGTLIVVTHSPTLAGQMDNQYVMEAGGKLSQLS